MVLVTAVAAVALSFLIWRATTSVNTRYVDDWAAARSLALTAGNRGMVQWYLHQARMLRTWGALGGVVLPPIIAAALGLHLGNSQLVWIFAGYLVGALYAEVALVRPVGDRRRAVLTPRRLEEYLPRKLIMSQRALCVLASLLAATLYLAVEPVTAGGALLLALNRTAVMVSATVVIAVGVCLELLERWLVRRPQPFIEPDMTAADDAIRSQSLHSVAGSGLSVQLLLIAGELGALAVFGAGIVPLVVGTLAVLATVGALYTCFRYGHRAWKVPRIALADRASA